MQVNDKHRIFAARLAMAENAVGRNEVQSAASPVWRTPAVIGYRAAVTRIQKDDSMPENVYWYGPTDDAQVIKGDKMVYLGPDAHGMTPQEIRDFADELRVLADIADEQA